MVGFVWSVSVHAPVAVSGTSTALAAPGARNGARTTLPAPVPTRRMPGNKKTGPTSARQPDHAASLVLPGLHGLDQHGRNANHYEKVLQWRQVIEDHPLFTNISQEMPLSIRDFGVQRPFNDEDLRAATLRDSSGAGYTAGINFFWRDGMLTPTPGIPVRTETIPDVVECHFKVPATMPTVSSSP